MLNQIPLTLVFWSLILMRISLSPRERAIKLLLKFNFLWVKELNLLLIKSKDPVVYTKLIFLT